VNLTYPQKNTIPTIHLPIPLPQDSLKLQASWIQEVSRKAKKNPALYSSSLNRRGQKNRRDEWKRDLAGRANGTIDPHYGCDLFTEMIDYALNFTFPWGEHAYAAVRGVDSDHMLILVGHDDSGFDVSSMYR
jgi:carboxypeptidase D